MGLDDPYAWQVEALESWRGSKRRGIVEAVTGTGKTYVGIAAAGEALEDLRRVAVVVPTRELQQQWQRRLQDHLPGVRVGCRGDGHEDTLQSHPVVVSIINSARGDALEPPTDSLLIADECHRYAADTNMTALSDRYAHRLGLTATLERPDQLEDRLKQYFGPVTFTMGYEQAIADEVTAHFTVGLIGLRMNSGERNQYEAFSRTLAEAFTRLIEEFGFPTQPFHLFMRRVAEAAQSDGHPASSWARAFQSAMHKRRQLLAVAPTKIGFVPKFAPAIRAAGRTLVFTDSIATSEEVCKRLQAVDLKVASLHSGHNHADRSEYLRRFASGYLDVVVAPRVLDEGVDVPEADLAIIVAGSNSRRQMVQRMGRVLRRKADGRMARLAVLFLEQTTEDPASGAHEVFLGEVLRVAEDYKTFRADDVEAANGFLSSHEPLTAPRPPRRAGEPMRVHAGPTDETFPVAEVLSLPKSSPGGPRRSSAPAAPKPGRTVSGDDRSRVRTAYRNAHRFISRSEEREFERSLDDLLRQFGVNLLVDAVSASPAVADIAAKAASRLHFEERLAKSQTKRKADAPKKPKHKKGQRATPKPSSKKSVPVKRVRSVRVQERPLYRSPSGKVRRCKSCGAPEHACRC